MPDDLPPEDLTPAQFDQLLYEFRNPVRPKWDPEHDWIDLAAWDEREGGWTLTEPHLAACFSDPRFPWLTAAPRLRLAANRKITGQTLAQAARDGHLSTLSSLDLELCVGVTDASILGLAQAAQDGHLSALSSLHLRMCRGVRNGSIAVLAQAAHNGHLPTLSSLDLAYCGHVRDASILVLAQAAQAGHLPTLSSLNLLGCPGVTDASICVLAKAAHNGYLPALSSLDLEQCVGVSDASILVLAQAAQAGHLPELTSLDLGGCPGVTDTSIRLLAQAAQDSHLPMLSSLHLWLCKGVTDASIRVLAQAAQDGHLPALSSLYLQKCEGVTDNSIGVLAQAAQDGHMPALAALDLSKCAGVSDASICVLAQAAQDGHLPSLASLGLAGCGDVTDASICVFAQAAIGGHLAALTWLDLKSCAGVTDASIRVMVQAALGGGLPVFKHIMLAGTGVRDISAVTLETGDWPAILEAYAGPLRSRVPVMVLGQSAAGKTWLFDGAFRNKAHHYGESHETTVGFELGTALRPAVVDGHPVTLRIFCFGGQMVQLGAHEAHWSADALYLLVLNAAQAWTWNKPIEWLRRIRHFGERPGAGESAARVLVVNQCNTHRTRRLAPDPFTAEALPEELTLPSEQIVEGFSCLTDDDLPAQIDKLYKAIEAALSGSALMRGRVNPSLPDTEKLLAEALEGKALLSLEDYEALCDAASAEKEGDTAEEQERKRRLSRDRYVNVRQLHYLGVVFFFGLLPNEKPDEHGSGRGFDDLPLGLRQVADRDYDSCLDTWIVNPGWVRHPVYKLLMASQEGASNRPGVLYEPRIEAVIDSAIKKNDLPEPERKTGHRIIHAVMKLTGLCYKLSDGGYLFPRGLGRVFVPNWDKGSYDEATLTWPYLHESAVHHFIVNAHRKGQIWHDDDGRPRHGCDGVVIQEGEVRAFVRANPGAGTVTVWLRDGDPAQRKSLYDHIKHRLQELVGGNAVEEREEEGTGIQSDEIQFWGTPTDMAKGLVAWRHAYKDDDNERACITERGTIHRAGGENKITRKKDQEDGKMLVEVESFLDWFAGYYLKHQKEELHRDDRAAIRGCILNILQPPSAL